MSLKKILCRKNSKERKSIQHFFSVNLLNLWFIYLLIGVLACRHGVIESERKLLSRSIRGQPPSETYRQTKERWRRLLKQTPVCNPLSVSYTWAAVGWFDSESAHRFTNLQFPRLMQHHLIIFPASSLSSTLWLRPLALHNLSSLWCVTGDVSSEEGVSEFTHRRGGSNISHRTESEAAAFGLNCYCQTLYALCSFCSTVQHWWK